MWGNFLTVTPGRNSSSYALKVAPAREASRSTRRLYFALGYARRFADLLFAFDEIL